MKWNKTKTEIELLGMFVFRVHKESGYAARLFDGSYDPFNGIRNQQTAVSIAVAPFVNRKPRQFCSGQT